MRLRRQSGGTALFAAGVAGVLALAAFCAFWGLDTAAVHDWDEARHGVNAYEMLRRGSWLVNTYRYAPDYWNLKPPLSFWAIIAGFRLFGTTVLALRFYAAASMFCTVAAGMWFLARRYGRAACLCGGMLLACATLFYHSHYGRSGDADALFGLLCTLCVLALFLSQQNWWWLCGAGLAFSLAFLDKSWHALVLPLIAGLFLLLTGRLRRVGAKVWAGALGCALLPVGVWAAARWQADGARFFDGMVNRDLLARSATPLEGHSGSIWYYAGVLCTNGLGALALCAALFWLVHWLSVRRHTGGRLPTTATGHGIWATGEWTVDPAQNANGLLFALWILLPLTLFSSAATKYSWYIYPTAIPLCMVCGIGFQKLWQAADGGARLSRLVRAAALLSVLAVAGINAWFTIPPIVSPEISQLQLFLERDIPVSVRGRAAYLQDKTWDEENQVTFSSWTQSSVFVAEAYQNFTCADGGMVGFSASPSALFIAREDEVSQMLDSPDYTVLARARGYVLLAHARATETSAANPPAASVGTS